jgi:uncharacterized protein (DUF1697 family)
MPALRKLCEDLEYSDVITYIQSGNVAPRADVPVVAERHGDRVLDEVKVRGREAYLHTPKGYGNSKLSGMFIEKQLQVAATARNWNTVTKLLDLAAG